MREISPLVRATAVMVVFVVTVVAAMFGSGVFDGMSMSETANGALAPDAHYVAPATAAFEFGRSFMRACSCCACGCSFRPCVRHVLLGVPGCGS